MWADQAAQDHEPSESNEDTIAISRTNTPPGTVHSDAPFEEDLSQERSSTLSPVVFEPEEVHPARASDATEARDPQASVDAGIESQASNGRRAATGTTGENTSPREHLPDRREAIARALSGVMSTDTAAPAGEQTAAGALSATATVDDSEWCHDHLPAFFQIKCGPLSHQAVAQVVGCEESVSVATIINVLNQ